MRACSSPTPVTVTRPDVAVVARRRGPSTSIPLSRSELRGVGVGDDPGAGVGLAAGPGNRS